MTQRRWAGSTLLAMGMMGAAFGARAADGEAVATSLEQRVQQQEQELAILRRRVDIQEEDAASTKAGAPQVRASATRFSIGSADGSNFIRLRAVLHADARLVDGGSVVPPNADTFILRRVRPTIELTFGGLFDFRITPDFASGKAVILDAYGIAHFTPAIALQVGKFKVPVGLERIQSASDIRFIERGFPTSLYRHSMASCCGMRILSPTTMPPGRGRDSARGRATRAGGCVDQDRRPRFGFVGGALAEIFRPC